MMGRRLVLGLVVVAGLLALLPSTATAHTADDPLVATLIAGGGNPASAVDVGEVSVWNDEQSLYVRYVIDAPGWRLEETHLHIATTLADIPQRNGNPVPGRFTFSEPHAGVLEYRYPVELSWPARTELFVAAHAVVSRELCGCWYRETAWAAGEPFPGKNWATYLTYEVQPTIRFEKIGDAFGAVGDLVDYTLTVAYTSLPGSPDLLADISDPLLGFATSLVLTAGQTMTVSAAHMVQPGDPDPLVNTATVTGSYVVDPTTPVVTATDSHVVDLFPAPVLDLRCQNPKLPLGYPARYVLILANPSPFDMVFVLDRDFDEFGVTWPAGSPLAVAAGGSRWFSTEIPAPDPVTSLTVTGQAWIPAEPSLGPWALSDSDSGVRLPPGTVVASITADIRRMPNAAGESALGDVVADAQLFVTAGPAGAQIAFMDAGSLRHDLVFSEDIAGELPGEITFLEVARVHPFNNPLVTMTLTGSQVHTALEQQFAKVPSARLQVSHGFAYAYSMSAPLGDKVDPATISLNGVPIDPAATYRVTVNEFIAGGGHDLDVFTLGTERVYGPLDIDALTDYLSAYSPVPPGPQNRVTVLP